MFPGALIGRLALPRGKREFSSRGRRTFFMQAAGQPGQISKKATWTGRVLSGLITAFLLFDSIIHILRPAPVVEAFTKLNFPLRFSVPLGVIELVCVLLYVLPATSTLEAIFLTGYLGGA